MASRPKLAAGIFCGLLRALNALRAYGYPSGAPISKRELILANITNHIMLDLMGNCEHFFHASLPYLDQHDSQYLPNLRLDGHWNLGWIG